MTRIIAGRAGGRRIQVPPGDVTRPTTDRVREALFSALEAQGVLHGARVLDLFAGSGALGLEAVSRGAAQAVLVESARGVAQVARRNAEQVDGSLVSVVLSSVERYLTGRHPQPADLVLADPPYWFTEEQLAGVLEALLTGWLAPDAVLVVERSGRGAEPRWPAGLQRVRVRHYGETALWFAAAGSGTDG